MDEYYAREKNRKHEEEELRYNRLQEEVFGKNPKDRKELPPLDETDSK